MVHHSPYHSQPSKHTFLLVLFLIALHICPSFKPRSDTQIWHNNFKLTTPKLCHTQTSLANLPVDVSRVMPQLNDITPLTSTIFAPVFSILILNLAPFFLHTFLQFIFLTHFNSAFKLTQICIFTHMRKHANNALNRCTCAHKYSSLICHNLIIHLNPCLKPVLQF